jgi:hypothetical protein
VRASLRALEQGAAEAERTGWAATAAATETIVASNDHREGLDAFFAKRAPRFTGH